MTKTERISGAAAIFLLTSGACILIYFLDVCNVGEIKTAVFYCAAAALSFAGFYGVFINVEMAFKASLIGFITAIIVFAGYLIALRNGWLDTFSDKEAMQKFISEYDGYAIAVFVMVQFLQVTVLPLPSTITTLAGIAVFGVWKTVLYSSIGIIAGSMFAFFLGRTFGVKLIIWICGSKMFAKYRQFVEGKDVLLLYAMFLLPFFPDDLLCLIAGLGTMSYRSFFAMMLITRPLGALWVAGVFKGAVSVPFRGWGLAVWAVIILCTATIFVLLYKYGDEITSRLSSFSAKISSKIPWLKRGNVSMAKTSARRKKTVRLVLEQKDGLKEIEKKTATGKELTDYRN